jgi:hypothetical protein
MFVKGVPLNFGAEPTEEPSAVYIVGLVLGTARAVRSGHVCCASLLNLGRIIDRAMQK